jgi:hypothetical protein
MEILRKYIFSPLFKNQNIPPMHHFQQLKNKVSINDGHKATVSCQHTTQHAPAQVLPTDAQNH